MGDQDEAPTNSLSPESPDMRESTIEEMATKGREDLKVIASFILAMKTNSHFDNECPQNEDRGEMIANIMLAYRHLEDARMRLGKVFQAMNGGESSYKK